MQKYPFWGDTQRTSALKEGMGLEIVQFCGQTLLIGCMNCGQGGGRVSMILKILLTSFKSRPLANKTKNNDLVKGVIPPLIKRVQRF